MNTYTWTNPAGGAWAIGSNWAGGSFPSFVAGDTADISTLDITANSTITGATGTIGTLKIGDTTASLFQWILGAGTTLTLASGSSAQPVINTLSGTSSSINVIVAGANGFEKQGTGNAIFTVSNTVTGTITIPDSSGTVTMGNSGANGAFAGISSITIGSGSVFAVDRSTAATLPALSTVSGTGTFRNVTTGSITIGATGPSFTGTMNVVAGTVIFSTTSSVTWACTITGAGAIQKSGTGTATLTAAGSSFTGAMALNAGTLIVSGTLTGSGSFTLTSPSTFALSGSGDITTKTLPTFVAGTCFSLRSGATFNRALTGAGTGVSSSGVFNADGSTTAYSGTFTLSTAAGTVRVDAGGTHTFSGILATNGFATTIQTEAGATFVLSGTATGSGPITKTSAGKLRLVGAAMAGTGAVTVSAGDLEVTPTAAAPLSFPSTLTFSSMASVLKFAA